MTRITWKPLLLTGIAIALLAGWFVPAGSIQAQGAKDKIIFVSNRDSKEQFDIYSMNPDGSEQTRLSKNDGIAIDPALSPDRSRIVYIALSSDMKKRTDLAVMGADGAKGKQLIKGDGTTILFAPSWSPDGKKIALTTLPMPEDGPPAEDSMEIVTVDADGKNLKPLGLKGLLPVWSPDGKKLLFSKLIKGEGNEKFDPRLYVAGADGANPRELISKKSMMGRWSPDGKRIVYLADPGDGSKQPDLFVASANGADARQLTKTDGIELSPEWSLDGKRIFFTRMPKGAPGTQADIFAIDLDGQNETQLTRDAGLNLQGGGAIMILMRSGGKATPKQVDND